MYLVAGVHLAQFYALDKFWILKICKKPKNFDAAMSALVRKTLYVAPIIHVLFSIMALGNPEIFNDTVSSGDYSALIPIEVTESGILGKFWTRLTSKP